MYIDQQVPSIEVPATDSQNQGNHLGDPQSRLGDSSVPFLWIHIDQFHCSRKSYSCAGSKQDQGERSLCLMFDVGHMGVDVYVFMVKGDSMSLMTCDVSKFPDTFRLNVSPTVQRGAELPAGNSADIMSQPQLAAPVENDNLFGSSQTLSSTH